MVSEEVPGVRQSWQAVKIAVIWVDQGPKSSAGMEARARLVGILLSGLFPRVVGDFDYLVGLEGAGHADAIAPDGDLDLNISSAGINEFCMRIASMGDILVAAARFFSEEVKESLRSSHALESPFSTAPM